MRDRRSLRALIAVPVVLATALAACSDDRTAATSAVEYQARDLRTGDAVDLADLRGKVVLLSSWATWCAPCRAELPALDHLYQDRKGDGLEIVAINVDPAGASSKQVLPMVDELGLTMPTWTDSEAGFVGAFEAISVPTNVLVGRDGKVVETWNGPVDPGADGFRQALADAIG
jgi:cytochrome c-type biogenesis protein